MEQNKFVASLMRLEALSLREKLLLVLGVPVVLLIAAEWAVFEPARKQRNEARKQVDARLVEYKALQGLLAAQPEKPTTLPADQLVKQRDDLQQQIEKARSLQAMSDRPVDWGTVVRGAASGVSGLTLTQLKTKPGELVYGPSLLKTTAPAGRPAAAAASSAALAASAAMAAVAAIDPIYRHSAELTVKGDFDAVLGYLQALRAVPGDLRWDKLQLAVIGYPQASVQLTLSTLSRRPETPFN